MRFEFNTFGYWFGCITQDIIPEVYYIRIFTSIVTTPQRHLAIWQRGLMVRDGGNKLKGYYTKSLNNIVIIPAFLAIFDDLWLQFDYTAKIISVNRIVAGDNNAPFSCYHCLLPISGRPLDHSKPSKLLLCSVMAMCLIFLVAVDFQDILCRCCSVMFGLNSFHLVAPLGCFSLTHGTEGLSSLYHNHFSHNNQQILQLPL